MKEWLKNEQKFAEVPLGGLGTCCALLHCGTDIQIYLKRFLGDAAK
jgi:hypothetical protein